MSETRNIGGNPVYPCLTLRDYFAAQAMTAAGQVFPDPERLAALAYEFADAMLKSRGE